MPVIFRGLVCSEEQLYASLCCPWYRNSIGNDVFSGVVVRLYACVCVRRTKVGSACFQDVFLEDWVGRAASVSAC